ncbi:MAG: polysaccharide pyruvyl transferase family protein [Candidatus Staskawiczbacteria bacterium]|nr:polysaccharide pyruvyl transferase family protein [Candidatus Staskawiczbacteria bacterium]
MKKFNIAIIGPTFSGNKGAATMLVSGIEYLNKLLPINKFYFFSYYPEIDKQINPYKNVEIYSATPLNLIIKIFPLTLLYKVFKLLNFSTKKIIKIKEIEILTKTDLLIDMAGVSFIDGREKFLPFNILTIWPALLLNIPIVKYPQSIGPFKKLINKFLAKIFLAKIKLIIARGKKTEEYLKSINLKNIFLGVDGGFSLNLSINDHLFANKFKNEHDIFFQNKNKIVGISPSSVVAKYCYQTNLDYEKILIQFIQYLINKKYHIILFPYSLRINSSSTFNNDLPICNNILKEVASNACLCINQDLSPQKLNALISLTDLFIASRFHSMVASLSLNIPTIVCGWGHKYNEVLEMFEIKDYAFDYKILNVKILQTYFEKLEFNYSEIKKKISRNLPKVKKISKKQMISIKNLLKV